MARLWWIGFAGFVGTLARYLLATWTLEVLGSGFPYGTLAVNGIGCFVLGGLMYLGLHANMEPTLRLALTTGFCGGFTTYSTFNYETLRYFQERAWLLGALNIAITLVVCLVTGILGWSGAKLVLGK
jgi:fluoride exporter